MVFVSSLFFQVQMERTCRWGLMVSLFLAPGSFSLAGVRNEVLESSAASRFFLGEGAYSQYRARSYSQLPVADKAWNRSSVRETSDRGANFERFVREPLALQEVVSRCVRRSLRVRGLSERLNLNRGRVLEEKSWFDSRVKAEANRGSEMQPLLSTSIPSRSRITESSASLGLERNLESGGRIAAEFLLKYESTQDRSVGGSSASSPPSNQRYSVGPKLEFQQPLLRNLGVRVNRAKIVVAENLLAQSQQELKFEVLGLVASAAQSYWELLFMTRILDIHKKSLDLAKEQLERSNKMVEIGHLAPAEVKAVERALASREVAVIESQNDIIAASIALRELMGERLSSIEVIAIQPGDLPVVQPLQNVDTDDIARKAIEKNPRVLGLVEQLKSERLNEVVAKNRTRPQLDLFVSLALRGISRDRPATLDLYTGGSERSSISPYRSASGGFRDAFRGLWSPGKMSSTGGADYLARAGLVFSWAPRARLRRGQLMSARSRIRSTTLELNRARQKLSNRLLGIYWARRASYSKLEVSRRAVGFARDNLRAEQARFKTGRSTNYDVLLRIEELTRERTKEMRAHVDVLQFDLQMGAITGDILHKFGLG